MSVLFCPKELARVGSDVIESRIDSLFSDMRVRFDQRATWGSFYWFDGVRSYLNRVDLDRVLIERGAELPFYSVFAFRIDGDVFFDYIHGCVGYRVVTDDAVYWVCGYIDRVCGLSVVVELFVEDDTLLSLLLHNLTFFSMRSGALTDSEGRSYALMDVAALVNGAPVSFRKPLRYSAFFESLRADMPVDMRVFGFGLASYLSSGLLLGCGVSEGSCSVYYGVTMFKWELVFLQMLCRRFRFMSFGVIQGDSHGYYIVSRVDYTPLFDRILLFLRNYLERCCQMVYTYCDVHSTGITWGSFFPMLYTSAYCTVVLAFLSRLRELCGDIPILSNVVNIGEDMSDFLRDSLVRLDVDDVVFLRVNRSYDYFGFSSWAEAVPVALLKSLEGLKLQSELNAGKVPGGTVVIPHKKGDIPS